MQTTLQIRGMTCNHCVMSVTDALERLSGVKEVKVSLEGQKAEVDYEQGEVDEARMREVIHDIGFEVV